MAQPAEQQVRQSRAIILGGVACCVLLSYGCVLLLQVRRGRSAAVGGNGSRESSRSSNSQRRSSSASKQKERRALAVSSRHVMHWCSQRLAKCWKRPWRLQSGVARKGSSGRVVRLTDWLAERPHRQSCQWRLWLSEVHQQRVRSQATRREACQ